MKRLIAAVLATCLVAPVPAIEIHKGQSGMTINLDADEVKQCDAEGGCAIFTRERIKQLVQEVAAQAYEEGRKYERGTCRNAT